MGCARRTCPLEQSPRQNRRPPQFQPAARMKPCSQPMLLKPSEPARTTPHIEMTMASLHLNSGVPPMQPFLLVQARSGALIGFAVAVAIEITGAAFGASVAVPNDRISVENTMRTKIPSVEQE